MTNAAIIAGLILIWIAKWIIGPGLLWVGVRMLLHSREAARAAELGRPHTVAILGKHLVVKSK